VAAGKALTVIDRGVGVGSGAGRPLTTAAHPDSPRIEATNSKVTSKTTAASVFAPLPEVGRNFVMFSPGPTATEISNEGRSCLLV
jgi:hypothetical protein